MELIVPTPEVAHAGLRALLTVAVADGQLHDLERRMLRGVQEHILASEFDLEVLAPIAPAQLAAAVGDPVVRERILSACVVMALIDGDASEAEGQVVAEFAAAFEIDSYVVADLQRLIDRSLRMFRIDVTRRSFIGQRGRAFLADQGVRGFGRVLRSLLGIEHRKLAARYRALEHAPRGTLGREYYEFIRANKFSLPGEHDAPPEIVLFHDCLHVLAGYQTSNIEETQIASFQAGMLKKDPVYGLLFMLSQFHLGVQVTPVTAAESMVADPQLMLKAFARGTRVNRNLCVDWNPTHDFDRTVEELRIAYNIEPRSAA